MSKYEPLWNWIDANGTDNFSLLFSDIENILGFPIDHSFLTYKKELLVHGYRVMKISMKEKMIIFARIKESK